MTSGTIRVNSLETKMLISQLLNEILELIPSDFISESIFEKVDLIEELLEDLN